MKDSSSKDFIKKYKKKKKVKKEEAKEPAGLRTAINSLPEMAKAIEFAKSYKLQKSSVAEYDWKNTKSKVDVEAHRAAEETGPQQLIDYLRAAIAADLEKIVLTKGILTVARKEQGLYNGFFQDQEGQIVDEFENMTIPMIAKNLQVKDLYYEEPPAPPAEPQELVSGIDYVRIKYGDFELEIKKSMQDFIDNHKKSNEMEHFVKAWRRNSKNAKIYKSNLDAAKAIIKDWHQHGEEFSQVVDAIKRLKGENK